MSEKGLGPRTLYRGDKFRIEEFLEARNMTVLELRNEYVMTKLAGMLCDFHNSNELKEKVKAITGRETTFFEAYLDNWYKKFVDVYNNFKKTVTDKHNRGILESLQWIADESFPKAFLAMLPKGSPIVLSHNDVHPMNLLQIEKDKSQIYLIDFEYADLNYRSADLAHYINQTMIDNEHPAMPGFRVYPNFEMSREEQDSFLKSYLTHHHKHYYQGDLPLVEFVDQELVKLRDEVHRARTAWHIRWTTWGIIKTSKNMLNQKNPSFEYAERMLTLMDKSLFKLDK